MPSVLGFRWMSRDFAWPNIRKFMASAGSSKPINASDLYLLAALNLRTRCVKKLMS
jgi:hypothetical protein